MTRDASMTAQFAAIGVALIGAYLLEGPNGFEWTWPKSPWTYVLFGWFFLARFLDWKDRRGE